VGKLGALRRPTNFWYKGVPSMAGAMFPIGAGKTAVNANALSDTDVS